MEKKSNKQYKNALWFEFADKVKKRDGNKCMKCERGDNDVVLQCTISY